MKAVGWILNTDRRQGADSRQFGILLVLMFAWMVALAVMEVYEAPGRLLSASFAVIAVQALLITARSGRERALFLALGIFLFLDPLFVFPDLIELASAVVLGFFLVFIPIRLSTYVLEQTPVNANTVFGALCAYLFMGLSFAVVYEVLIRHNPAAIATPGEGEPTFVTWVYFSFTTLTTLGYGDIAPRAYATRMIAILEALIGQIYLVVVVARLVGTAMEKGRREE